MESQRNWIASVFTLYFISSYGQAAEPIYICTANEVSVTCPVQLKYKADNVTKRKEFYDNKPIFDPADEYDSLYIRNARPDVSIKTEKGIAKVMDENNKAQIAYYNNAGIGTILKLTNPDNGSTTYAIVVGKLPPGESSRYMLMLSDRTARKLSLKDYSSIELICYTGH